MISRSKYGSGAAFTAGLAVLTASLLLGVFGGTAFATESAPVNTALPTISGEGPYLAAELTASTGTWTSEAPAHWFGCNEQAGGKYANSECAKQGYPSSWESVRLKEGEKSTITAKGSSIVFSSTIAGLKGTVTCETEVTSATLENPAGGGSGLGNAELTYKSCTAGGGWASCTVTPGATVPVKLELATVEGSGKVYVLPTGANLGTLTFSKCTYEFLNSTYKIAGKITGLYSNSASQIEFNTTTTFTGLTLNGTIKLMATGTIGLETSKGGHVAADSLTYAYAWNRCVSEKCSEIAGATSSSYTVTAADVGKKLSVSVTATNPSGSTTATSKEIGPVGERLSWYKCAAGVGPGVYEDANCSKKGASNSYSWFRPASMPATTTNTELGSYTLGYTLPSEFAFTYTCTKAQGTGTLVNNEGSAAVSNYQLTLSNCVVSGGAGCKLQGEKLVFNTLKASSPKSPEKLTPKLKFEPSTEGATVATYQLEGCTYEWFNGQYLITGSFPAQVNNEKSFMSTSWLESKETLKVIGKSSTMPARFEGASKIASEEAPVKLDVAP